MAEEFDPDRIARLLAPERYEDTDPQRLISMLPILVYHEVADIGCGPGFFTIPLAKYLFDGKVYALDVSQEMLDAARERVEEVNLTNVELKLTDERTLALDDESVDGAFISLVLHGTDSPETMLSEALRCLRKGGWLAALEFKRSDEHDKPETSRIEEAEVREIAQRQGFRIEMSYNLDDRHYVVIMRK